MNDLFILGLDIGGANTKAALIIFKNLKIVESYSYIEYFPFWEKTLNDIPNLFRRVILKTIDKHNYTLNDLDFVSITITAELSDAFQTKREGILKILNALKEVFDIKKMFFINIDGKFIDFETAQKKPLKIAAANWVSTALFLGKFQPTCILIDAGSTTIDIIPILNSVPITKGKDDISRLINHELVYTGGLRATLPSITHFVPYKGDLVRISFEKFALISDVHRILNNITENEYVNDTADNRSKSLENCYARLARTICMDLETISTDELDIIAKYLYEKQLEIVEVEIQDFYANLVEILPELKKNPLFVITGLSANFLIKPVLEKLGFNNINFYEKLTSIPDHISSSAFAVAGALYYQILSNESN